MKGLKRFDVARKNKSGGSDYMKLPYLPGDTIPAPDAVEIDSEEALRAWNDLHAEEQAKFAQTQPMDALPSRHSDPRYAKTEPSPLLRARAEGAAASAAPAKLKLEDVLFEARRYNRVCPRPEPWKTLHATLLEAEPKAHKTLPPVLTGSAWDKTPSLSKRMVFREQLEWAEKHGCLALAAERIKALPEDAWYHMGD